MKIFIDEPDWEAHRVARELANADEKNRREVESLNEYYRTKALGKKRWT